MNNLFYTNPKKRAKNREEYLSILKDCESLGSMTKEQYDAFYEALISAQEAELKEFDRRTAMRNCRFFKTVAEIQPVLDFLDDYGYIRLEREVTLHVYGRPLLPKYTVNPWKTAPPASPAIIPISAEKSLIK